MRLQWPHSITTIANLHKSIRFPCLPLKFWHVLWRRQCFGLFNSFKTVSRSILNSYAKNLLIDFSLAPVKSCWNMIMQTFIHICVIAIWPNDFETNNPVIQHIAKRKQNSYYTAGSLLILAISLFFRWTMKHVEIHLRMQSIARRHSKCNRCETI